jgi:hypothetical protein
MPDWLERVRQELAVSGIPVGYQGRLLDELRDHLEDMQFNERNRDMSIEVASQEGLSGTAWESRLGDPKEIARLAQQSVWSDRFASRHPIVTYVLFPVPLLVVLWVAYAAGLIGLFSGLQSYREEPWAIWVAGYLVRALPYLPAIVATLALARVADRSRTALGWWIVGSGLIGLVSGMLMVTFRAPTTPGTGLLSLGLGFPPQLAHWPQVAVPIAVMTACVLWAMIKRGGKPIPGHMCASGR